MSNFVPGNYDLRTALILCYHLLVECSSKLTASMLLVNHSALSGLKNSEVAILTRGTKNVDQKGVIYYELLKPGETVNTERYRQQMIDLNEALREKPPEYQKRQHKVILLRDNAPSHTAKPVKETIEAFSWEILSHAAYSPELAPSDYYLFASMGHALSDQRFTFYENVRKCLDD